MSLNESIVEDAALEWFLLPQSYGGQVGDQPTPGLRPTRLGFAVGHGAAFAGLRRAEPSLAPGEPAAERSRSAAETDEVNSFSEVVLVGRLREAIRRPAAAGPAIPEEASACALHGDRLASY